MAPCRVFDTFVTCPRRPAPGRVPGGSWSSRTRPAPRAASWTRCATGRARAPRWWSSRPRWRSSRLEHWLSSDSERRQSRGGDAARRVAPRVRGGGHERPRHAGRRRPAPGARRRAARLRPRRDRHLHPPARRARTGSRSRWSARRASATRCRSPTWWSTSSTSSTSTRTARAAAPMVPPERRMRVFARQPPTTRRSPSRAAASATGRSPATDGTGVWVSDRPPADATGRRVGGLRGRRPGGGRRRLRARRRGPRGAGSSCPAELLNRIGPPVAAGRLSGVARPASRLVDRDRVDPDRAAGTWLAGSPGSAAGSAKRSIVLRHVEPLDHAAEARVGVRQEARRRR